MVFSLPPLKCPLCPEGVSLSAAQSDRQSGALKAHAPFFYPASEEASTGPRVTHEHTHTHTHTLSVFRATGARTIRLTAPDTRPHTGRSRLRSVCVKCFVRKVPLSAQTATVGCPSRWALSGFRPFLPGHPLSIEQAFVSSLISGPVSVLIRWEKGDSEAVKSSGPPLRSVPAERLGSAGPRSSSGVHTCFHQNHNRPHFQPAGPEGHGGTDGPSVRAEPVITSASFRNSGTKWGTTGRMVKKIN